MQRSNSYVRTIETYNNNFINIKGHICKESFHYSKNDRERERDESSPRECAAEHLDEQLGSTKVREMALSVEDLDGGPTTEMVLEVRRHRHRHRHVPCGLHDHARRAHQTQHATQISIKDRARNEQRDIRPHVEQRPAELPDRRRHIGPYRQWRESPHPRLVVLLHRREHPLDLPFLKSSVVILVIQKPSN